MKLIFFSLVFHELFLPFFLPFLKVHLNREHHYNNQDQIQSELSGYVMELAPYDLPRNTKVPFLSLGGEIDVGIRQERCRGKSETSGGILFFMLKRLKFFHMFARPLQICTAAVSSPLIF